MTRPAAALPETHCAQPHGPDRRCRVVLVNPHPIDAYRTQLENAARAALRQEPFASAWTLEVVNTLSTVEAQNAALARLLDEGVDGLILDPLPGAASVGALEQACAKSRALRIVTFGRGFSANAPCIYQIQSNVKLWAMDAARWITNKIGCTGKVVFDRGQREDAEAQAMYEGWQAGLTQACSAGAPQPLAEYWGKMPETQPELVFAALLGATRDVSAVFTQGSCELVARAFQERGLASPPLTCEGTNRDLLLCAQPGRTCFVAARSYGVTVAAMETLYDVLRAKQRPYVQEWLVQYFVTEPGIEFDKPTVLIRRGVNAWPDAPPGLGVLFNWSGPTQISLDEALGRTGAR